jgi:beta-lactamase class A
MFHFVGANRRSDPQWPLRRGNTPTENPGSGRFRIALTCPPCYNFCSCTVKRYVKEYIVPDPTDLAAALAGELAGLSCQYAFYCRPAGREPIRLGNHETFVSASLIKVPILFAWAYLERQGRANRAEMCELDLEQAVQGAGLSWLLHTRRLPFHDVLLLMTALSDNLCANLVIQRIGMARLNTIFRGPLGLRDTALNRKMMDFAARQAGHENYISARDCIQLFHLRDELTPDERAWIDPMLQANPDTCLWLRDLAPDSVVIGHKGGSLDEVLHDWAYTDDLDVCLLTQRVKDYPAVYGVFGKIGALLLK